MDINIGLIAKGTSSKAPKLGDSVVVGFGVAVVGEVEIANHVAIGAGSVVTKSILDENLAVGGGPTKIISLTGRLEWNR